MKRDNKSPHIRSPSDIENKREYRDKNETHQIQGATDEMVAHTGTILTTSTAHENDRMLLDVVALAGDIGCDHAAGRQTDTRRLALTGVGLLRSRDTDFQAHALLLRTKRGRQSGRDSVARSLRFSAAL